MRCFFKSFQFRNPFVNKTSLCLILLKKENIPLEVLEKIEVLNSETLNKVVDISFENSHQNSFQSSFKDRSDSMQEELLFGQPCHDKQVIEYFEICHVFYDPVAKYMDKFFRWSIWLYVCSKGRIFHHNLLLFCSYVLISIKHEEEMELLDKLPDWLHWKS